MPILTSLLYLIIAARLLGQVFQRFNQPTIVGEMLAGLLLGPSVFNVIQPSPALSGISELSVFLIVVSAGLEMNFNTVMSALFSRRILVAILAFVMPLGGGIAVGMLFELSIIKSVFLGLCISITALPVTVRILQSFNMLNSEISQYSVATAIFNDIAALLALGVILRLPEQQSYSDLANALLVTGGKLIVLALFIISVGALLHGLIKRGIHLERIPERFIALFGTDALFGIVVVFSLAFGSVSEMLGFHFIIGAFFGALLIDKKLFIATHYDELERTIGSVATGFLAPVFFVSLGLEFSTTAIDSYGLVVAVLIISIVTKIYSGWLGGRMLGLSKADSIGIGVILNGRGIMELVVASIGYQKNIIDQGLFSTLVFMGVFTTMLTPLLFKRWVIPLKAKDV